MMVMVTLGADDEADEGIGRFGEEISTHAASERSCERCN